MVHVYDFILLYIKIEISTFWHREQQMELTVQKEVVQWSVINHSSIRKTQKQVSLMQFSHKG